MKTTSSYFSAMFQAFKAPIAVLAVMVFMVGFPPSSIFVSSASDIENTEKTTPVDNVTEKDVVEKPASEKSESTPVGDVNDGQSKKKESAKNDESVVVSSSESIDLSSTPVSDSSTAVSTRSTKLADEFAPMMPQFLMDGDIGRGDNVFLATQKISSATQNGATLHDQDRYGVSLANLGDLDRDGNTDILVGAHRNDTVSTDTGAVYIHFRKADGSIRNTVEINKLTQNGPNDLNENDQFGVSVANIGDLNNDGVTDIAVGSYGDDTAGPNRGSVRILFLNTDGSVKSTKKIDDNTANGPILADNDRFGVSIDNIGDRDSDGVQDLAIGSHYNDAGGTDRGAWFMLFMNTDGSVKSTKKFDGGTANGPTLADFDYYGTAIKNIGDIDHDGVSDIAVSANYDNILGVHKGAVYIHFMNANNTIKSTKKIDGGTANGPTLFDNDYYGTSIENMGDLNGDGVNDIAVGAETFFYNASEPENSHKKGEVFIHFLNTNGSVKATYTLDEASPNGPALADNDFYGQSIAKLGDINGDGLTDMAVGAFYDDTGGENRGAFYVHNLKLIRDDGASSAGITVSKTSLTLAENGGLESFTVVLNSQPASDVVINVTSSNTGDVTVVPATLTFTPTNWNVPQKVFVTAIDDNLNQNDTAVITVSVNDALSDDIYDSVSDVVIPVTLTNDETSGGSDNNNNNNGGGHGGGGGGRIYSCHDPLASNYDPRFISRDYTCEYGGNVLGASTETLSCEVMPYLTKPIKLGASNNPEDVKLLERYLNTYEGANIPVDGVYSQADFNLVVKWQEKYSDAVLKPWGISKGTGYVFMTSLQKIKQVHKAGCALAEVPTQILSCSLPLLYPTQQVKQDSLNDSETVKLLEKYLNTYENASLPVDGVYSIDDINAVKKWQDKYVSEIFGSGDKLSAGNVLDTSLAKIKQTHTAKCALFVAPPEF